MNDKDYFTKHISDSNPEISNQNPIYELADIPALEIILKSIMLLMSGAAEKLGLSNPNPAEATAIDLDEARKLITSLAALVSSSVEYLGLHAKPIKDGVKALQLAFREASAFPDAPGKGPGENFF